MVGGAAPSSFTTSPLTTGDETACFTGTDAGMGCEDDADAKGVSSSSFA